MIRRAIVKCKTQRKTIIYPLNYELTKVVQFKFCSGHPKNSQFSAFMGLNKDLDELRIKEAKDEKKDVREYSFVIIAALTILGGGFFVLYLDNGVKFQFELLCNQLKLKIITSPKHRVDIIEESLTKISEFLRKHPYDYGKCTNSLLFFSSFLENMKNPALAMKIAEIYQTIIKRNYKAAQNKTTIENIKELIQLSMKFDFQLSEDLVNVLLLHGSIKEVFLAVKNCEKRKQYNQNVKTNKKMLEQIAQNLKKKNKKNQTYYQEIGLERLIEQFPQIAFKRQEQMRWLSYVQKQLNISLK